MASNNKTKPEFYTSKVVYGGRINIPSDIYYNLGFLNGDIVKVEQLDAESFKVTRIPNQKRKLLEDGRSKMKNNNELSK